jgi:hypothetical protein
VVVVLGNVLIVNETCDGLEPCSVTGVVVNVQVEGEPPLGNPAEQVNEILAEYVVLGVRMI